MITNKERIRRQFIHAQNRFRERYNSEITKEQYDDLVSDVQNNYCQPIASVSNTVSVFRSGEWVFVYDRKRHTLMTFLTEDMIDNYIEKEKLKNKRSHIQKRTGGKNISQEMYDSIYNELAAKFS